MMSAIDKIWNNLSLLKRTIIVATFALCLTMIAGSMSQSRLVNLIRADESVIFEIKKYLAQNNIQHTVTSTTQIQVDESIKAKTLLELGKTGIIGTDTGMNYEIFDEFSFGMTDDLYEINIKRVLENKLRRMIIDGDRNIINTYVSMSIPKTNYEECDIHYLKEFHSQQKSIPFYYKLYGEPKAAIKVIHSSVIPKETIEGIQNIVASSVETMTSEQVKVFNKNNKLISHHTKIENRNSEIQK